MIFFYTLMKIYDKQISHWGKNLIKFQQHRTLCYNYIYNLTMSEGQGSQLQQIFLQAKTKDTALFKLLEIGRQTGFGNFINRKQIWPFLLELDAQKLKEMPVYEWKGGMDKNSFDYEQLQKDADRSLASMKPFEETTKFHLKKKQEAVLAVLDTFFAKNKELKYIQGFHDVASVFLILFGNSTGYYLMEKAGRTYFHDFLTFEFGSVGMAVSQIVYQLVIQEDPEFTRIYSSYQQTKFLIFILPWVLTWFSHNFTSVKTICRIWDYLLCTGPHGVFYLTAGIILSTKSELLAHCEELDEPSIQTFYQEQARKSAIDIELAISKALQLEERVDIATLQGYQRLDPKSMYIGYNFYKQIGLHQGFHVERKNALRRSQRMRKLVKTATVVAGVVLVGVLFAKSYKIKIGEL